MGQAASFDGKVDIQGGDVAGFGSVGYRDDPFTMAAWIYPTADTGFDFPNPPMSFEPSGYGLQ